MESVGQTSLRQQLESAVANHQAGRLAEAEAIYRRILAQQPDHADTMHLLGVVAGQTGRSDLAEELIRKAIGINPNLAQPHNNLGHILALSGRFDEAINHYRRAIEITPDFADAHNNLAFALNARGQSKAAIGECHEAIRINPRFAEAHVNLGNALHGIGKLEEAASSFKEAIRLRPELAQAHNNLGNILRITWRLQEAIASYHSAIRLEPDLAEAHLNLGLALEANWQFDEAIAANRNALRLKPDYAEAFACLGTAWGSMGQTEEAISYYRKALRVNPSMLEARSNLIFMMNFHGGYDAKAILQEARRWDEYHGKPLHHLKRPHKNRREPNRRLRIGYVSPDLHHHVVGWNLLPLLSRHDRRQFEIFAYSSSPRPDAKTKHLQGYCDHWREALALSDEDLAEQIRADEIDVLIDLSLHTADNRLRLFAIAPAPVQITYLAYCGTSGVSGMNYRLSDPHLDPPEQDLNCYSEQTIRLAETYWCYAPGGPVPEPSTLPADHTGHVTFGSMNQFGKVSAAVVDLWHEILKRVPQSRLLIHAMAGEYLRTILNRFEELGIASDRVEVVGRQEWQPYINTYQRIDISLDTIPYNGGITTCDNLVMGVPVVTLSGQTPVGRGGRSILCNIGLPELVAYSPEEYVNLAVRLAGDLPRLRELRKSLRGRMQASPLMNAARFARNVEAAYREAWRRWCAQP
jgi:predicted O-linked N-acetylglucosamine transferase (SPINDLY family)